MPKVKVNGITMNYDQQGDGEPLILIPYMAADNACYAFQVAEYAKHFTCISVDPRGAGETDKPEGVYSTELFADDVSRFHAGLGIDRAHIAGLSLGAAWVCGLRPSILSRSSPYRSIAVGPKPIPFSKRWSKAGRSWPKALGSVTEMVILGIFPWCFTPELYAAKPDYIQSLAAFVRGRPAQPVDAFMRQSNAVISHDVEPHLGKITAPTQITCWSP